GQDAAHVDLSDRVRGKARALERGADGGGPQLGGGNGRKITQKRADRCTGGPDDRNLTHASPHRDVDEKPMVGYPMEVRGVKGYSGGGGKTGRRQANGEPRPAPRLGRRVDRAAVLLDDAAADAEPEAGPHLPLGGEERLPDPGQVLGGDPDPVVLDL